MGRIHRALDLTAFAQSQTLDGIGREKHVGRLWRVIPLRGTQESKTFFGHLEPAFHDDRLSLRLGRIATPIVTSIFSLAALVALVSLAATLIIIAPLLVVAAIAALSAAAAATSLIVALPLMATMSLMVTAMSTSTAAAALTEATLAAARTEGALMALLTLRPALLGISLKTRGISSAGA